jgi:hypothetical protein
MNYETAINGKAGKLSTESARFTYQREGADSVVAEYTVETLGRNDF